MLGLRRAPLLQPARYTAKARGLPHTLTEEEWSRTFAYFGGMCAYCQNPGYNLQVEHVVAVRYGGGTVAYNCVPACPHCNARKGKAHLSKLAAVFGHDTADRVLTYLVSVAREQKAERSPVKLSPDEFVQQAKRAVQVDTLAAYAEACGYRLVLGVEPKEC